ncbi:MAG TPA: TRAP transporter substrate-binding protein DctP [Anaeromyxobacteraceae bacterium]|nr:TRAP transporter substrate-binding protein DctP [Anaeromyxobacteraceae bacterium]
MTKKIALAILVACLAAPASAQVTIKLGTLAPQGSTWHEILKDLGQRWEQASGGKVKLKVYAGGVQGSEGDMVRKMGINQLQAVSISNIGMHDVIAEPQALAVPMFFADEAEMMCAFDKVRPRIEGALAAKNLIALQWSKIGEFRFFCDAPYKVPAEAKDAKVFCWDGDPKSAEAWRASGYRPVVLSGTDIYPSFQTGMVDCIANVPSIIMTMRVFEKAKYMVDTPWGNLLGATLVRKDTWEKIDPALRAQLQAIAIDLGKKVDAEVARLNTDAIAAMKKQGLVSVPVDPAPWRAAAEKSWPVVRGGVVPADFFDQVKAARDACRVARKK